MLEPFNRNVLYFSCHVEDQIGDIGPHQFSVLSCTHSLDDIPLSVCLTKAGLFSLSHQPFNLLVFFTISILLNVAQSLAAWICFGIAKQ